METTDTHPLTRKEMLQCAIRELLTNVFKSPTAHQQLRQAIPHLEAVDEAVIEALLINFNKVAQQNMDDNMDTWLNENKILQSFTQLGDTHSFKNTHESPQKDHPIAPDTDMPSRLRDQISATYRKNYADTLQHTLKERQEEASQKRHLVESNLQQARTLCNKINSLNNIPSNPSSA